MYKSSHLEVSCKKGVLRNFTKFTRKHLCQSIFSNKVASLHPALKRYPGTGVLKNTFSIEHLRATASKYDVTFRELFRLIELFTPKSIDPPKLRNFRESHTAPFNYHPLTLWNFLVNFQVQNEIHGWEPNEKTAVNTIIIILLLQTASIMNKIHINIRFYSLLNVFSYKKHISSKSNISVLLTHFR